MVGWEINCIIIQHIDTLHKYGQKNSQCTYNVGLQENAKIKSLSTIFSLQTLFCYQCVEL